MFLSAFINLQVNLKQSAKAFMVKIDVRAFIEQSK